MGVRSRSRAGSSGVVTQSVTTTASGIGAANIPANAMVAEGYINGTNVVRFTLTGSTPTATVGTEANPGDIIVLNSRDEIDRFSAYSVTATIDWEMFTDVSG